MVTGASRGIGHAIAAGLTAEGCFFYITSRTREAIERAANNIQAQQGMSARARALGLSKSNSIKALLDAAGNADVLVNDAGTFPGWDLQAVDEARWRGPGISTCSATPICGAPSMLQCGRKARASSST